MNIILIIKLSHVDVMRLSLSLGKLSLAPPQSLSFCHHAPVALARWQQNEKTVTRVICVLDDFSSSAFAVFKVDVLQRGESRP